MLKLIKKNGNHGFAWDSGNVIQGPEGHQDPSPSSSGYLGVSRDATQWLQDVELRCAPPHHAPDHECLTLRLTWSGGHRCNFSSSLHEFDVATATYIYVYGVGRVRPSSSGLATGESSLHQVCANRIIQHIQQRPAHPHPPHILAQPAFFHMFLVNTRHLAPHDLSIRCLSLL